MRCLTVTGVDTASRMAFTQSATSAGCATVLVPIMLFCTRPARGSRYMEADLVVTRLLGQARARSQVGRHAAAQLQGQRVFRHVVAQETVGVVVQQGAGGDHFGVEQGVLGQQTQEEPAGVASVQSIIGATENLLTTVSLEVPGFPACFWGISLSLFVAA